MRKIIKDPFIHNQLKKLVLASILGWIVYLVGTICDSIVGGSLYGEEVLAAIEIITPIGSILYFISCLLSVGGGIYHSYLIGKNEFKKANTMFSTGIYCSIVFGIICALALYFSKDAILGMYELSDEVYEYASDYYDPFILTALVMPIAMFIYYLANSDGDNFVLVSADCTQVIVNLILSIILGKKIGVIGLSIATFLAYVVYLIIPSIHLFRRTNTCKFNWRFNIKDIGPMIKFGSTLSIGTLSASVLDIVMNYFICSQFGDRCIAAYAIVNFTLEVACALSLVANSMGILMNVSEGEKNNIDIKEELNIAKSLNIKVSLIFSIGFMLISPLIPGLFSLESADLVKYSYITVISIALGFIFTSSINLIAEFYITKHEMFIPILSGLLNEFIVPIAIPISLALIFNSYIGLIIGFALTAPISFGIIILILYIKNKKEIFKLPTDDSKQFAVGYACNKEKIGEGLSNISSFLKENKIDDKLNRKIQLVIEETLVSIIEKNEGTKKKLFFRISIIIDKDKIIVFEKDSGKIFNVIDKDQKIKSLSNYVLVNSLSYTKNNVNYLSASSNANKFEFDI